MFRHQAFILKGIMMASIVVALSACGTQDEEASKPSVIDENKSTNPAQEYVVKALPQAPVQERKVIADKRSATSEEQTAELGASGSDLAMPEIQSELEQARQSLESARDENSELNTRIQRLEEMFQEQERMMEQQDKKLSDLKQQLERTAPGE
jgi:chromosome segregation ATPase